MPVQPTEPVTDLDFATNVNYAGGDDVGTATKSEPAAGRKADGWRGNVNGDKPPAQEFNWWQHWAAKWLGWLFDVLTVGHDDNGVHRLNTIDTLQLVALAVETAKIDNLAVTAGKIGPLAVETAKIDALAVTTAKIAAEAVVRSKILEESSNFVFNPDAHMGDEFWWDGKDPEAGGDYDTPGTDVDQATEHFDVPLFVATSRNATFALGTYFSTAPATTAKADLSEKIDLAAGVNVVLSFLSNISGYNAGDMNVDIVCYDAAGKYQGIICPTNLTANEATWTFHEAAGTTLANGVSGATADTDYIRVRRWIDVTADATLWRLTRIKVNGGEVATAWSDDASKGQYLSARYSTNAGQVIATGSRDVVNYEDITFDDPGTNRVTIGAGWFFEADRYMKVSVTASVVAATTAAEWDVGENISLWLYKTPAGGAAAIYTGLDTKEAEASPAGIVEIALSGTDGIELNEGDKIDIRFQNSTGANVTLSGAGTVGSQVFIREIS